MSYTQHLQRQCQGLMLENQKQGEIIKILLHQVSNLTALLRVELGEERAVSRYPRECKRGDKV
jgi:hypothetical protein